MAGPSQKNSDLLQARIEELDVIFDSVPALISYIDAGEVYRRVNRAYEEYFAMRREDIVGKTVREMVGEEYYARARPYIERALSGERVSFQTRNVDARGSARDLVLTYTPDANAQGRVRGFTVLVQDVTAHRQAEERATHVSEQLGALISASPLAIIALTAQGNITLWNPAAERVFGWTEAEVIGKPLPFIPEEKLAEHRSMRARDLAGEGFTGCEVRRRRKDGSPIEISVSTAPVRDAGGNVIGIMSVYVDITHRRAAEQALRESEMRYRFMAESIPQMVWTAKPDGNLDYVNEQVVLYFGVPPEAVLGSAWLEGVHSDDRLRVIQRWHQSLVTGDTYEIEFRLRRHDGEWRWHLVRALPFVGSDGSIASWFGTCTDIEDQKRIEEELRKANHELEEFAYVASHDLQEPLRTINVYSQLLLRKYAPEGNSDAKKFSGYIESAVVRMQRMIHDLLAYSRAIHDRPETLQPERRVNLKIAFDSALAALRARVQETGAAVSCSALPVVRGDEAQIEQVFQNLLSNALKYRQSHAKPEVTVDAELRDGAWTICVRDNGIGFDPQYKERIFGLFRRLHRDEYPGTGLGLAICKRIVERHGGHIWADSAPGQGASFYFTLPG